MYGELPLIILRRDLVAPCNSHSVLMRTPVHREGKSTVISRFATRSIKKPLPILSDGVAHHDVAPVLTVHQAHQPSRRGYRPVALLNAREVESIPLAEARIIDKT
uniref:Uncharacterized protein n=1 Tax=Arundo donax TaxID=35708 RepID=A0A0A8XQM2_ARUDO